MMRSSRVPDENRPLGEFFNNINDLWQDRGRTALTWPAPVGKLELGSTMKTPRVTHSRPPPHLSPSCKRWWNDVVSGYVLEPHHLRLLQLAAEAWDENQAARQVLAKDGLVIPGREGGLRPHPAVAIARDARLAFARLIRALDLDNEPPVPIGRGP